MGEPEQIFWDGVTWLWLGFIGLSSLTIAIEQPGFERVLTGGLQQLLPLQQRLSGAKLWLSVADVEPRQHVDIIGWLTFLGLIVVMLGLFPYEYALPPGTGLTIELLLLLLALSRLLFLLDDVFIKNLLTRLIRFAYSARMQEAYTQVIQPYTNALKNLAAFVIFDLVLLVVPDQGAIRPVEVPISLGIGLAVSLIGISLFKQFFKVYLLDVTLDSSSGLSIELLSIVRIFANGSIVVMVIVAFSVTHGINLFGLIASLGIGGLAIAFAAKNSLEQLFGSVVLYLDRPFVPGDYVTLKDGTFGRVESIGLRSSKIRTSGRGTLIVIPNNSLASMQIENYTDAKKVISLLTLSFYRTVPQDERSLMRQIILESTRDIYGIDGRNTEVEFRGLTTDQYPVGAQAQITFFLLGSEASSMEIRCQLLDVASQRITRQLADYGIIADRIEPTIYVDSPITV